eukprot:403341305
MPLMIFGAEDKGWNGIFKGIISPFKNKYQVYIENVLKKKIDGGYSNEQMPEEIRRRENMKKLDTFISTEKDYYNKKRLKKNNISKFNDENKNSATELLSLAQQKSEAQSPTLILRSETKNDLFNKRFRGNGNDSQISDSENSSDDDDILNQGENFRSASQPAQKSRGGLKSNKLGLIVSERMRKVQDFKLMCFTQILKEENNSLKWMNKIRRNSCQGLQCCGSINSKVHKLDLKIQQIEYDIEMFNYIKKNPQIPVSYQSSPQDRYLNEKVFGKLQTSSFLNDIKIGRMQPNMKVIGKSQSTFEARSSNSGLMDLIKMRPSPNKSPRNNVSIAKQRSISPNYSPYKFSQRGLENPQLINRNTLTPRSFKSTTQTPSTFLKAAEKLNLHLNSHQQKPIQKPILTHQFTKSQPIKILQTRTQLKLLQLGDEVQTPQFSGVQQKESMKNIEQNFPRKSDNQQLTLFNQDSSATPKPVSYRKQSSQSKQESYERRSSLKKQGTVSKPGQDFKNIKEVISYNQELIRKKTKKMFDNLERNKELSKCSQRDKESKNQSINVEKLEKQNALGDDSNRIMEENQSAFYSSDDFESSPRQSIKKKQPNQNDSITSFQSSSSRGVNYRQIINSQNNQNSLKVRQLLSDELKVNLNEIHEYQAVIEGKEDQFQTRKIPYHQERNQMTRKTRLLSEDYINIESQLQDNEHYREQNSNQKIKIQLLNDSLNSVSNRNGDMRVEDESPYTKFTASFRQSNNTLNQQQTLPQKQSSKRIFTLDLQKTQNNNYSENFQVNIYENKLRNYQDQKSLIKNKLQDKQRLLNFIKQPQNSTMFKTNTKMVPILRQKYREGYQPLQIDNNNEKEKVQSMFLESVKMGNLNNMPLTSRRKDNDQMNGFFTLRNSSQNKLLKVQKSIKLFPSTNLQDKLLSRNKNLSLTQRHNSSSQQREINVQKQEQPKQHLKNTDDLKQMAHTLLLCQKLKNSQQNSSLQKSKNSKSHNNFYFPGSD